MFKKYKNNIFFWLIMSLLITINVIGKMTKFSYLNNTIYVEYSPKYMNSIDYQKMMGDSNKDIKNIELYKNSNTYNERFNVTNMFPGDSETKYYCINVSYEDELTLKYSIDIKSEFKKIEDVFNLKVKLINTNEILYDDLLKNMPDTIDYNTKSSEKIIENFCYEITVSLDTSVGNEYQNKETIIDFNWVAIGNEIENESNPITLDNITFWISLAFISSTLLLLIFLILKKEKKD